MIDLLLYLSHRLIVFFCYFRLEISGTQTLVSVYVVKVSIFLSITSSWFIIRKSEWRQSVSRSISGKASALLEVDQCLILWPMCSDSEGQLGHGVKIRFSRAPCPPTPLAKWVHSSLCKLSGRMADFTERNAYGSAKNLWLSDF